jgi:ribulose-phosphate 3-epimerase
MGVQIAASVLASDFAHLAAEAARVPHADWLHVDVMDNPLRA